MVSKSDLLPCLEALDSNATKSPPDGTAGILDGVTIINTRKAKSAKTCEAYAVKHIHMIIIHIPYS